MSMLHIPIVHTHDISKQIPREKKIPNETASLLFFWIREFCFQSENKVNLHA